MKKLKAIALFSGGLDSILSVYVMRELGVEVIPIHFNHVFLPDEEYKKTMENIELEVLEVDVTEEFLKILHSPKHGFGKNINPCIDCKILYLKKAKEFLKKFDANFIITGEVVGQRPFSQRRDAMKIIEKEANVSGIILRPLTQKNFAETELEKRGLIKREKLLAIKGRGRKIQLELAKKFKLKYIPSPAGGCLLTSREFSLKIKDLMKKNLLSRENVEIVKNGRYFSLSDKSSLIVSRNEKETKFLEKFNNFKLIKPVGTKGPVGVVLGVLGEVKDVFKILNKYFKNKPDEYVIIDKESEYKFRNEYGAYSENEIKKFTVY